MPCGAMAWTTDFLHQVWEYQPGFRYVGIDVTPSVVKFNQDAYKVEIMSLRTPCRGFSVFEAMFGHAYYKSVY